MKDHALERLNSRRDREEVKKRFVERILPWIVGAGLVAVAWQMLPKMAMGLLW